MLGDIILKFLHGRPKPLQAMISQIQESNASLARLRLESGQAPAYYIKRPTGPAKTISKEKISYVI